MLVDEALSLGVELPHAALSILYTAFFLGISHQFRDFIAAYRACLHLQRKFAHSLITTIVYSVDDGERQLSFSHIVARRLADFGRVVIVEDVVANLESDAEILTEQLRSLHILLRSARRERTDAGTSLEESRRLLLYHVVVDILRDVLASDVRELQNLAVGERASEFGKIGNDLLRVGASHAKQRRRKDIVAHEHSHLIVVSSVHRRLTATLLALVHHVVVHERSRMQQFQTHGSILRRMVYLSEVLRHEQNEHWTHTLACTLADMLERRAEQSVLVRERLIEKCDEIGDFRLNRVLYN